MLLSMKMEFIELKRGIAQNCESTKIGKGGNIMWQCPKCKREFAHQNQSHYCGEKPKNIDEYILRFDGQIQSRLEIVRKCLKEALPKATEKISWSMPTYWNKHNIVQFAAHKNHIGLYTGVEAVIQFSEELEQLGLKYSKGSIQIPYSDELPCELIKEIAIWCDRTGNHV